MANIAYCKIFPSIGIARLGDSETEFFLGPEAPGNAREPEGGFKDEDGRTKRQGARFRVYGFDEAGNVLQEINASTPGASITWSVQVANLKAAWYQFMGVKAGQQIDQNGDPTKLRNQAVIDRMELVITPSARSINGVKLSGPEYEFDDGFFFDQRVYLGELRTDEAGHLIVLGGRGKSGSTNQAEPISNHANNDYWYDDVSDGPVMVSVKMNGVDIPLKGTAWVIVAPPKFAPHLQNIVTLYEVMGEAAGLEPPDKLSFTRDIYPIFDRIASYPWVNAIALRGHGPLKRGNFHDKSIITQLADNSDTNAAYRESVLMRIRNPRLKSVEQANYYFMPILSGDEGKSTVGKPETWFYLLESQYAKLEQWAAGNFDSDWDEKTLVPAEFDKISLADQPDALTHASLEYCVGGPFFPGIETTYVVRNSDWYEEPYRLKEGKFQPGEMTKRMAVPWQANFYESKVNWWPVQRPDDIINEETFKEALSDARFIEEARSRQLVNTLQDRIWWDRGVGARLNVKLPGANDMVEKWKTLGFVVPRATPYGETLFVESGRSRYDGLRDRDYFFYLLNIDAYPDFVPKAKQLAEDFLQGAIDLLNSPDPKALDDEYEYFDYTPEALAQRLDEIYTFLVNYSEVDIDDLLTDKDFPFRSKEAMVERIRQFAPFNQLDGAWIRNIGHMGPIDRVTANIFSIWMDEMGDGNVNQNHSNLYTQLLEKVGIHLDPIYTKAYANNPDMLESAYTVPMYQMAISQFTQTFYPEILGMTLNLEWEVLLLKRTIKLFKKFELDAHFYELHVGIDNAANGHGAKAREAVELFLDEALARGGDAEVQRLWRRIWTGYVAFATTGTVGQDLIEMLQKRKDSPSTPADKVVKMMQRKKPYGSLNHDGRHLGQQFINDLFENPDAFMKALIDNGYIVPGSISESSFFEAISFEGPMYKVFTDEEIQIWEDWVVYLGQQACPQPPETDPAKLMIMLVDNLRELQTGTPGHEANELTGPDPDHPGEIITQTVAKWFAAPAITFLSVLSDPANPWIVKGSSASSKFITVLLGSDNRMSRAFDRIGQNTGGKTWRQIATDWIDKGCPLPSVPAHPQVMFEASPEHLGRRAIGRLTLTSSQAEVEAHPRGRILGMGDVH